MWTPYWYEMYWNETLKQIEHLRNQIRWPRKGEGRGKSGMRVYTYVWQGIFIMNPKSFGATSFAFFSLQGAKYKHGLNCDYEGILDTFIFQKQWYWTPKSFTRRSTAKRPLRCGIVVLQNRGEFANPIAASNIHMRYRLYSVLKNPTIPHLTPFLRGYALHHTGINLSIRVSL